MKLKAIHYAIIISCLLTAYLHISLYPDFGFTTNGIGYISLLAAYFLPIAFFQDGHDIVWWGLAGYTLLTIILWMFIGDWYFVLGTSSATGYYAKTAEIFLLIFLWVDKPVHPHSVSK